MDEWKGTEGYPNYAVSASGKVKNVVSDNLIKPEISNAGYCRVGIVSSPGKSRKLSVHRLVALSFLDNPYGKPQVNHIDADKLNNSLSNLEWATRSENSLHALSLGIGVENALGVNNGKAKLKEVEVLLIRELQEYDRKAFSAKWISRCFKISEGTVYDIRHRRSWKHI